MSVEVERKFVCNADTVKTLEEIGGMCLICLPHTYTGVNLELRPLTDAVIQVNLQMVTEGLLQHLMALIAVVCTATVVTLAICLLLIM